MRPAAVHRTGAGFAGNPIAAMSKVPTKTGCIIFFCLLTSALCLLSSGCGTVTPKPPTQAAVASYDAGVQNSGVICLTTNSTGSVTGAIITSHARDRYNALIGFYGARFSPPLAVDAGISPWLTNPAGKTTAWQIDAEHLVDFMRMNRWHRAGGNLPPGTLNAQPLTPNHP